MQVYQAKLLHWVAYGQGAFYVLTGIWPIVHIESFIWVTGPKYDIWLVKTVGVLIIAVGGSLLLAARNHRITPEIMLLAVGCALGLTIIDVYYVSIGRIWKVYLLDAVAESMLIILWLIGWRKSLRE
jgi:hypothetical protein